MSYLQLNGLNKQFNGTNVLNNVHLEVAKGEMITLLGPSGCGKSTLLRCISGLTELEQGSIILEDQEITALAPREREVGMVFQSYALFPNLTVSDNVGYGLKMKRMNKSDRTRKINELLELVDLSDKAQAYPHTLSGGQQQRVALARSLAMQPKLMLLDEPLSALDAKIRKSLRLQIRQLQRRMGMTMIFVTHDQEEALMISDRICVMHNGRIVQEGSPEEIYSAPRTEFVARFIGNYNVLGPQEAGRLEGLAAQPGISYALRPESITLLPVGENAMTQPPSFSMPRYPSSSMSEYPSSGMTERESSGMLRRDSFGVGHDLAAMPERDSSSELDHDSAGMLGRESGSGPGRESVVRGYDSPGMARHLPPAGDSAALYWPGKVSSVMMLGNIVRYGIDVGGIPMTVDTLAGHGPFRPGEQSEVTLRIDRSQCIPLEKDGA